VIDELTANPNNGITVPSPDLYGLFLAHPEYYINEIEPNGLGYQAIAQAWRQAIAP
jgi:hypothetical protein